jgi:secreted Zn-dependent insulinase-like peptidase
MTCTGVPTFLLHKSAASTTPSPLCPQVPKHANYLRLYALCSRVWHHDKVLPELEALTPDDVAAFLPQLLRSCHLECMLHGNLTLQEATELAKALQQRLGPGCNLAADQRVRDACIKLESSTSVMHCATAKNPDETNAAVEVYYQVSAGCGQGGIHTLDGGSPLVFSCWSS